MPYNVEVEYKKLVDAFGLAAKSQVGYVAALTATNLGKKVEAEVVRLLPERFDRPTPFTLKKVKLEYANKTNRTATVYFPGSEESKGKNRLEYIRPGALGTSSRSQKRSEVLLMRAGYLPPGWVMSPGTYLKTKLDQYGNVPGQYYRQVIRNLQIKPGGRGISKASTKRATRMTVDNEFFAVKPGANKLGRNGGFLPSGIYQRAGRGGRVLLQYFKFIKKAAYKQRINLEIEATKVISIHAQQAFSDAITQAQGTFLPGLKVT